MSPSAMRRQLTRLPVLTEPAFADLLVLFGSEELEPPPHATSTAIVSAANVVMRRGGNQEVASLANREMPWTTATLLSRLVEELRQLFVDHIERHHPEASRFAAIKSVERGAGGACDDLRAVHRAAQEPGRPTRVGVPDLAAGFAENVDVVAKHLLKR